MTITDTLKEHLRRFRIISMAMTKTHACLGTHANQDCFYSDAMYTIHKSTSKKSTTVEWAIFHSDCIEDVPKK